MSQPSSSKIIDPIAVGFWRTEGHATGLPLESAGLMGRIFAIFVQNAMEAHLPSVFDHIEPKWDPSERNRVLRYVSDQRWLCESYMGYSTCRICGKDNGSADFSDGWYKWPEGLAHYISAHSVRPPGAFVAHVLRRSR